MKVHAHRALASVGLSFLAAALTACGGADEPIPFSIGFAALSNGEIAGCTDQLGGFGPQDDVKIGVSDLRFYVSHLHVTTDGEATGVELSENEFQYTSEDGEVALVDLTSNTNGACSGSAISLAEGTARMNEQVLGTAPAGPWSKVSFDVGLPQSLMKAIIQDNSAEAAPSPMNEMYWSWASGYRHFVFNFTVENGAGEQGEGYLHIGSRDCGAEGTLALEDKAECGLINTARVELTDFDPTTDSVKVDLDALLENLDFIVPILDPETREPIAEGPGVACHSAPGRQPDCMPIFSNLGMDPASGTATAGANRVFSKR